ncbi:MAG: GDSL-type esterase/lipase family protein [Candidatus Kaelpia aquatica]|nr:GDSL-type esterase/lipase family protein [Candidatus Kaelpia aquatica]
MKKSFAVITLVVAFFFGLEFSCRILVSSNHSFQKHFLMQIYDETLGAYDENLFWRLEGVYPQFGEEEYRVICLSDSVSVMYGGYQEYPKMLEEILIKNFPESTFKIFNAGVPGYSSYQGALYLKNELIKYKPDFVSINFGPNDYSRALNGLEDKKQKCHSAHLDKYFGWSKFYQCYKRWILSIKQKIYNSPRHIKQYRVSKQSFKNNLINMIRICRVNGSKAILLTSPYLDEDQGWVKIHKSYNDIIRLTALEEDAALVDLAELFSQREDLFIDPEHDHVHINLKGYKIIARELFNIIKTEMR